MSPWSEMWRAPCGESYYTDFDRSCDASYVVRVSVKFFCLDATRQWSMHRLLDSCYSQIIYLNSGFSKDLKIICSWLAVPEISAFCRRLDSVMLCNIPPGHRVKGPLGISNREEP